MSKFLIVILSAFSFFVIAILGPTLASAQKGGLSQGQAGAIAKCLGQCKKSDRGCRNVCLQSAETRGLLDKVKACMAGCRDQVETPADPLPPGVTAPLTPYGPFLETLTRCLAGCAGGASGTP